ncbi:MAG: CotH kinase family protein, partial [Planctomycetes bacterium]|nr:CotH kinase family protein [Planctomycetota bacterium]
MLRLLSLGRFRDLSGCALLVFCLATPTRAQTHSVDLDHLYFPHPEAATARASSAIAPDGTVYPYSTLVITFHERLSNVEMGKVERELRVSRIDGDRPVALPHLHEVVLGLPAEGPHASFHWVEESGLSTLRYRPHAYDGGHRYHLSLPPPYSVVDGDWATCALTGFDPRVYEVVIPDETDWRVLSEITGAVVHKEYVPAAFFDRFSAVDVTPTSGSVYPDAEIRIRGNASLAYPNKRYTVKFPGSDLFRGFKDESGVFQGGRKQIAFISGLKPSHLFNNMCGYDVYRELERSWLGVPLSPDSYFVHLVLNGHYWGAYVLAERIQTGKGGLTEMLDRDQALDLEKRAVLHEAGEGNTLADLEVGCVEPKTDFEETLGEGDGATTHFTFDAPHSIYGSLEKSELEPDTVDVQIKTEDIFGFDLVLIPDPSTATFVYSGIYGDHRQFESVALVVEDSAPPITAGIMDGLNTAMPVLDLQFPVPPADGEDIDLEYNSVQDWLLYDEAFVEDPTVAAGWFDVASTLRHMFFVRFATAGDSVRANHYYLMNNDELS